MFTIVIWLFTRLVCETIELRREKDRKKDGRGDEIRIISSQI